MDHTQNERLKMAAQEGNIDALYDLIKLDPIILDRIDEIPFVETPLHVAAVAGRTHFAFEIMGLKPSFGRKLNPDGFSPLHLALQNGHMETVKRLVKIEPELIRVQSKGRFTLLHYVVEKDEIDLLAEFLFACPPSIEDVTSGGETAVHIAMNKENIQALDVLLGWIERTSNKRLLNMKDEEGNTPLHIAASNTTIRPQVVRHLITHGNKNQLNSAGLTALDVGELNKNKETMRILHRAGALKASSIPIHEKVAPFLTSREKIYERFVRNCFYLQMSSDMKNVLLVVAVLILTATYQAALTPPDALWNTKKNSTITTIVNTTTATTTAGNNVNTTAAATANSTTTMPEGGASNKKVLFMAINSLAMSISVGMMIFLLLETNYLGQLLAFSLFCMMLNYLISVTEISTKMSLQLLITIISWLVLGIFVALLAQIKLFYGSYRHGHVYRMQRKVVERKYSGHQD